MTDMDRCLYPRLRALEAVPVMMGENHMTCLRDPQGLAERPIFLNSLQAYIVSLMDGTNSIRDIQAHIFRRISELIPADAIESLVAQLDACHYLDSALFRSFLESLVEEYRGCKTRPARHAGGAYETRPDALQAQIRSYFDHPEGPGNDFVPGPNPLRGLIAPHIDYHRGGPTYAHAYKVLAAHPPPDRFIIFGTSHSPMERRFALTFKDYETPLGLAKTDGEFVEKLSSCLPCDYTRDEFAHRGEHSIEFQAVLLRYVLPEPKPFTIIPILVGPFHDIFLSGKTTAEEPEIQAMIRVVRKTMDELPGRYCIIAGADLAHVGMRFGDHSGPTRGFLQDVEREDRKLLEFVQDGDAEGVFRSIAVDRDRRRVCGYPPIYMTLGCLGKTKGRLLRYTQWADLEGGAAVTFASVALY